MTRARSASIFTLDHGHKSGLPEKMRPESGIPFEACPLRSPAHANRNFHHAQRRNEDAVLRPSPQTATRRRKMFGAPRIVLLRGSAPAPKIAIIGRDRTAEDPRSGGGRSDIMWRGPRRPSPRQDPNRSGISRRSRTSALAKVVEMNALKPPTTPRHPLDLARADGEGHRPLRVLRRCMGIWKSHGPGAAPLAQLQALATNPGLAGKLQRHVGLYVATPAQCRRPSVSTRSPRSRRLDRHSQAADQEGPRAYHDP